MLPFKTGAFLAGVPVQPVVIKYHRVSGDLGSGFRDTVQSWERVLLLERSSLCFEIDLIHPQCGHCRAQSGPHGRLFPPSAISSCFCATPGTL